MATNTGKGYRQGAVSSRTERQHPKSSEHFIKRNANNGQFMHVKLGPHKGVANEVDNRRS